MIEIWKKNPRRNLWQHPIWADFQTAIGRKVWWVHNEGAVALTIKHDLPKGLCWLEIPRGPLFENKKSLNQLLDEIKDLGKKEKAIFVRMSPFEKLEIGHRTLDITKHDHQPETSLVIDLDQTEEDILSQMKPKGRYNIKVALKHGVTAKPSKDIDVFYQLLEATGFRDHFGIHPKSYYEKILDTMPENAQLFLAEYQGEVIAGGLFVYLDEWGIYYYGASVSSYRNVMAPYLIQWEAIKEAKRRGCKHYDFLGIAPEGAEGHPWSGVTEFKKKFGGRIVHYPQAKEMILQPFWHLVYRIYKLIKK